VAVPVDFGVYIPQLAFGFDDILARVRLCEELGIGSFWLFDHLYGPGMPDQPALEGWTLATALLAATSTIRVGHLVLDNNLRHPVLLGKMATTLDVISGGRLDLGIGSGSYEAEHHEGGFPWGTLPERTARLGESLEILTRMFGNERTSFEGEYYQVRDFPNLPRPVQRPRPPIHVGGVGERFTIPLVARYADVWNVPTYGLGRWERVAHRLDEACEEIGRDPSSLRRSIEAVLVLAPDAGALSGARRGAERRYAGPGWGLEAGGFVGTPPAVVDRVGSFLDKGITQFVFFIHDRGQRETLELLAEEVISKFR
jgi:alkanesulfonate monooxygenase SsuD/methylene tetrahydromethanopterin reductase-like flavin-dependent oxidoreductase (luciferase family)